MGTMSGGNAGTNGGEQVVALGRRASHLGPCLRRGDVSIPAGWNQANAASAACSATCSSYFATTSARIDASSDGIDPPAR